MDWFIWQLFLIFLVVGVVRQINNSKNKAGTAIVIFIFFTIYFIYDFIEFLYKTDIFNAFTPYKNGGISLSFIGIILLIGTTSLFAYLFRKYIDKQ